MSSSGSEESPTPTTKTRPISDQVHEREDLQVFNLLQHPVWVFDIERKAMYWANTAALEIWNAETVSELIQRDFSSMSDTILTRMNDQLVRLRRGELLSEQWTAYPKGKPKQLALSGSAIRIDGGRIAALTEAELPNNTDFQNESVRGMEILRYLPMAVCQFDLKGNLAYQNPEAIGLFGGAKEEEPKNEDNDNNQFLARFVDQKLGQHALDHVAQDAGQDYNVEAEQYTLQGNTRTFSVSIRRSLDPVTSNPIILYSARDITEILKARRDTTKANIQSDFMAVISHEIRTPLHQIIGYLDLLELTELSLLQLETVKLVQGSSVALMSIINDMLTYSKLENGKLRLEQTVFDPDALLNACMATIEKEANQKELKLVVEKKDLPSQLIGDPNRLRQVLLNLLDNAVKFTETGTVSLIVTARKDDISTVRLHVEVQDTGIGIHPHHHIRIFEKYEQANAPIHRNYGGTGLGLSICKSLTEIMSGEITLQSELGKGTTFFLGIPFLLPTPRKRNKTVNTPTSPMIRRSCEGLRILVVEDNMVNQKMMSKMLQRMGHLVHVADHGNAAVDEVRVGPPFDMVLMDVQMPICDGIDATKQIRGTLGIGKQQLPIVGITASFEHSAMGYYKEVGMNTCIGKPIRMNALKRVIEANMKTS